MNRFEEIVMKRWVVLMVAMVAMVMTSLTAGAGIGDEAVLTPSPDQVPAGPVVAKSNCSCVNCSCVNCSCVTTVVECNVCNVCNVVAVDVCRPVRVKDLHNVAPCSVPTTIVVCDPVTCCNVSLVVCMPPACCVVQKESLGGRRLTYDLGKHQVQVKFLRNEVVIDYDK